MKKLVYFVIFDKTHITQQPRNKKDSIVRNKGFFIMFIKL